MITPDELLGDSFTERYGASLGNVATPSARAAP